MLILILILVFLSMVHEYAYFFMNTFGNRSITVLEIVDTGI